MSKKTFTLACLLLLFFGATAKPCSVFSPINSSYVAANYDWLATGGMAIANPKGLSKVAFLPASSEETRDPAKWTAQYASLTLTQWGREFPVQGVNTAGLVGVLHNGPASWPTAGPKGIITKQQWLQYQLDNFSSINDVARHVNDLGILGIGGPLQYFFCDRSKDCAWIFFSDGVGRVKRGNDLKLRAMTNSSYDDSIQEWDDFLRVNPDESQINEAELPQRYHTVDRFIRASWYSQNVTATHDLNKTLFDRLKTLAGQSWTQWQTVIDTAGLSVYLRSFPNSYTTIQIDFPEFNRHCTDDGAVLRKVISDPLTSNWGGYTEPEALAQLKIASQFAPEYSTDIIKEMIEYPRQFECAPLGK
jgi:choloylglycine hydrolase